MIKNKSLALIAISLLFIVVFTIFFTEQTQVVLARLRGDETLIYPKEVQFGSVKFRDKRDATFKAYNFTEQDIEIKDYISSCKCHVYGEFPKTVPARDSVEFTISVEISSADSPVYDRLITFLVNERRGMALHKSHLVAKIQNPMTPKDMDEIKRLNREQNLESKKSYLNAGNGETWSAFGDAQSEPTQSSVQ